jgi:hypothetical protein
LRLVICHAKEILTSAESLRCQHCLNFLKKCGLSFKRTSKNGVYKVTFFDENYSFYFQDFPSKLPNSWILARAYSILSGVLDSRRVRFSKRYHDAPNTATKILSDKTMILFSHFIFAVPSYHLVLLALEFIHNFNFPLPFCSLHSLFVFQLYSSTANLIMVHIIL